MKITSSRLRLTALFTALALLITFQWGNSPTAMAGDLACGATVNSDLTLTHDLVCPPTFLGNALTVTADGITLDGATHEIVAPGAPIGINLIAGGNNNVTIKNIGIKAKLGIRVTGGGDNTFENVSTFTTAPKLSTVGIQIVSSFRYLVVGSSASGYAQGIRLQGDSDDNRIGNTIGDDGPADKNTITGNGSGIWLDADTDNNLIKGNDLTGNGQAVNGGAITTGLGNQFIDNDMSNSAGFSIFLRNDKNFVISGNDFTGSNSGLKLKGMAGINLSPADADLTTLAVPGAPGGSGIGIEIESVTGSSVTNFSIPSRIGIRVTGGGNNRIENVTTVPPSGSSVGVGIQLVGTSDNIVVGATISNHSQGVRLQGDSNDNTIGNVIGNNDPADKNLISGNGSGIWLDADADNNLIKGNDLSSNNQAVFGKPITTGSGNQFIDNDMSGSAGFAIVLAKDESFVISGNDFTGSASGIHLYDMSGITLSSVDVDLSTLSFGGVGVQFDNVSYSFVTDLSIPSSVGVRVVGILAAGTGGGNEIRGVDATKGLDAVTPPTRSGVGFQFVKSNGNVVVDSTASNHAEGIRFDDFSASNVASCSTFTDNAVGVIAKATFASASVTNSLIDGNNTGALNQGTAVLLAENNHWGAANGPAPAGTGDSISGNVDADPFLSSAEELGPLCSDSLEAEIEIQTDKLNTGSKGVLPVAILGSSTVDVADIDVSSVSLNQAGAAHDGHVEDVNNDGIADLMVHPQPHIAVQGPGVLPAEGEYTRPALLS